MTEAEWLVCDNPGPMLDFLCGKASDRRLRLFACACWRRIPGMLEDRASRDLIRLAERYADGAATEEELSAAFGESAPSSSDAEILPDWGELLVIHPRPLPVLAMKTLARLPVVWAAAPCTTFADVAAVRSAEQAWQSEILRCIVGNPFRPRPAVDPNWLARNGGSVRKLAQAIDAESRFGDLPILADALEEAGCSDEAILSHCRSGGEHARGCWAVDLLTGRE